MNLLVYADESYLFNGNDVIAVAGWLCDEESLKTFRPAWQKVLDCYGAKNFHFREFADKKNNFKSSQCVGWDADKRERFLFDLALVACEAGIPVGGCSVPNAPRENTICDKSLKMFAYGLFGWSVLTAAHTSKQKQFNHEADKIEFVFDKNDDPKWKSALDETMTAFKERGAPFGEHRYEDDESHLPLQAADLYVYAMRQNAENYYYRAGGKPVHARMLDFILEKNRTDLENWTFSKNMWATLVLQVWKHYRNWSQANPDKKYYPLEHCPMLTPPNN